MRSKDELAAYFTLTFVVIPITHSHDPPERTQKTPLHTPYAHLAALTVNLIGILAQSVVWWGWAEDSNPQLTQASLPCT